MRTKILKSARTVAGALLAAVTYSTVSAAQGAALVDLGGTLEVGGDAERYLRVLQLTGAVPAYPWTIQPFTPAQSKRLAPSGAHPWSNRFSPDSASRGLRTRLLRPAARLAFNSSYAFQDHAGPAWTGRGLNLDVQGGARAQWRWINLQLAPVVFHAQNSAFTIAPPGDGQFGDPRFAYGIDLPQRFGSESYGRLDAGSSSLTFDVPGVAFGLSTAPQRWGPGLTDGLVLGPNSGGFNHAFVGTGQPVDVWIAKLHARYMIGSLEQSGYWRGNPEHPTRLLTAIALLFVPRGVEGLELGITKLSERWMPPGHLTFKDLTRPFISGFNRDFSKEESNINIEGENGMASAFFRWALPSAGAEVYGELYREDFAGDLRRFLSKPDDLVSYILGFQHATSTSTERIRVIRAEVVNGQLSHVERGQRGFGSDFSPYLHHEVTQGHTNRGQLIGSPAAFGGAGTRIAVEEFTARGRRSLTFERSLRMEQLPVLPAGAVAGRPDVLYALRFEEMRFRGGRDYTLTVAPAIDLNRYLASGHDEFNLYVSFSARGWR